MANTITTITFDAAQTDVMQATQALGGLKKTVKGLQNVLMYAFCWDRFSGYVKDAVASSGTLQKELLVLRMGLGKLKNAFGEAIAPVAASFIPIVNQAVRSATKLITAIGQVIAALFRGSAAEKVLQENAQYAAKAQESLSESSGKVSRSLANFDEIERLSSSSGSGSTAQVIPNTVEDPLSPELEAVVSGIQKLLQPLKELDLSGVTQGFAELKIALEPIKQDLFAGLHWAWENLLVPLAKWTVEDFLPQFLKALAEALRFLREVIVTFKPLAEWLWENFLQPLAQWVGQNIIDGLESLTQKLTKMSDWAENNRASVLSLVEMLDKLKDSWQATKESWADGSWLEKSFFGPAVNKCKAGLNQVIGFINSMIGVVVSGINALISSLNKLQFSIPGWVPGYGGKQFGLHLKPVTAPKIPMLAQGAVLPANRPFLAVLGDQKNGTNIEAPLETIKQALGEVLAAQGGTGDVNIKFTGDLAQLARVLKPVIDRENRRVGGELIRSTNYG